MKEINVGEFKTILESSGGKSGIDFINVCTPAEYAERHIKGVRSVPLDTLQKRIDEFKDKESIYIHCRSGARGRQAAQTLEALGIQGNVVNVQGGILAWEDADYPTESLTNRMPLMQQVLLTAGTFVVLSVLLSLFIHKGFVFVALFVGCGQMFAGLTGWCGLSYLLERMPWNK